MLHEALSTTTTNTGQDLTHNYTEASCSGVPLLEPGPESDLQLPDMAARGGLAGWQLRKVIRHIENDIGGSLRCGDLAAVARLSTGHFCRAFKTSMGEPPHAYVIRQRIRRAQRLMLHTDDALSEIACTCGLTDQAHLTRLFRRVAGTTPKVWRNRWRPLARKD